MITDKRHPPRFIQIFLMTKSNFSIQIFHDVKSFIFIFYLIRVLSFKNRFPLICVHRVYADT